MTPTISKTKTGKNLILREAIAPDAPALIPYVQQVAGESDNLTFGAGEFNLTIEQEEKVLKTHHDNENQIYLIAEVEGEIAGVLIVMASQRSRLKHICEFAITVRKKYWGQGIGSQMISVLLQWARESEVIRKVNLKVLTNNTGAIALYEKYGFRIEGTLRRDSCIEGEFYDAHLMGILIDQAT